MHLAEIEVEFPPGEVAFEMSNLSPRETGLDFVVFVLPKIASHAARIEVTLPPWGSKPEAVYTIAPQARPGCRSSRRSSFPLGSRRMPPPCSRFGTANILYDEDLRTRLVRVGDAR